MVCAKAIGSCGEVSMKQTYGTGKSKLTVPQNLNNSTRSLTLKTQKLQESSLKSRTSSFEARILSFKSRTSSFEKRIKKVST